MNFKTQISIPTPKGNRLIGPGQPCFIVAEMSANHGQSLSTAEDLIKTAAVAGADAIKLQTYTPDSMTIDSKQKWFYIKGNDNPASWQGKTFYEVYQEAQTPREWHAPLKKLAESLGLVFFSSPFSSGDVDFLQSLNVDLYKIASYEATDLPLLKAIAKTGKPIIMSVGFATAEEISLSVDTLKDAGVTELALLHCVTSYAEKATLEDSHLATMLDLQKKFNLPVGFSDNNGGIEIPVLAAALGAAIIEKHFFIGSNKTLDQRFSLGEDEFATMVKQIRNNEKILGSVQYGPLNAAESYNRNFRRSLFVVKNVSAGELFTAENIRSIRPGFGLPPQHLDDILGKSAKADIAAGTPLNWDLIK